MVREDNSPIYKDDTSVQVVGLLPRDGSTSEESPATEKETTPAMRKCPPVVQSLKRHPIAIVGSICVCIALMLTTGLLAHSLTGGFHTLEDAVDNVLGIGNDVTHSAETIMSGVGKEVTKTYVALGKDYDKIKDPILAFTDMVAEHGAGIVSGLSNATSEALGIVESGEHAVVDGVQYVAWQLKYAAWFISCAFKEPGQCKTDFYEKFHLCGHPDRVARVGDRMVTVHEPCKDAKWKVVWDAAAVNWEMHKTNIRLEHCKKVAREATFFEEFEFCVHITQLRFHMDLTYGNFRNCRSNKAMCSQTYCLGADGKILQGNPFLKCILASAHRTSKIQKYDSRLDLASVIDGKEGGDAEAKRIFDAVAKSYIAISNGNNPRDIKYPPKVAV